MGADRNENEPEEYDPEAEFRDPESDSLTIPQIETENAGSGLQSELQAEIEDDAVETEFSPSDTDVDPDLLKQFWALVLVLNAAILAVALGVLFIVFEGTTGFGAGLLAAGVVLGGFAVRRYRNFQHGDDTSQREDDADQQTADADQQTADADQQTADADSTAAEHRTGSDSSDAATAESGDHADDRSDHPASDGDPDTDRGPDEA